LGRPAARSIDDEFSLKLRHHREHEEEDSSLEAAWIMHHAAEAKLHPLCFQKPTDLSQLFHVAAEPIELHHMKLIAFPNLCENSLQCRALPLSAADDLLFDVASVNAKTLDL
jgi:hypothetical protein